MYDRNIIGTSSEIFGFLWQSSAIFGKCLETFVKPSEQFWKIFANLRRVVGNLRKVVINGVYIINILVPRGSAPFGQHQESRPLARSNNGSPRFTDFPSLCACSESSLTNLIGSGLNLLCLQSHSKPECRWTGPEVAILGADQKERDLWGRE